jgi:APA family basic amino acid/polyamine antiporter
MIIANLVRVFSRRRLTPSFAEEQSSPTSSVVDDENGTTKTKATLKRSLDLKDLILYGIGCSVGAGIYTLVGIGANIAGPAITLSFLLCGVACMFTSLCYADFAARIPLSGSAYTFTYVAFGELCGWIVGWNLTLGYAISAAAVARSWAVYVASFLSSLLERQHDLVSDATSNTTSTLLTWLTRVPIAFIADDYTCCPFSMVIIALCTLILVTGVKESSHFNNIITIVNVSVLGFVVFAGAGSVKMDNLQPFMPPDHIFGLTRGAGLVFFSFLGFDMVSCLSEEVINPEKTMPAGIIGSLLCSIIIYVSVSLVVVGMAPIPLLGKDVPLINAFLLNACCSHSQQLEQVLSDADHSMCLSYSCAPVVNHVLYYGSHIISFAAVFGLTTATFTCLMGQPRIFYKMAQDGLMFKIYAKVNRRTGVPTVGTIITGVVTALVACFVNLEALANVISLGTLQVFTFVNAGVLLLRSDETASLRAADVTNLNFQRVTDSSTGNSEEEYHFSKVSNKQNGRSNHHATLATLLYSLFVLLGSMAAFNKFPLVIVCFLFTGVFFSALYIFKIPWEKEAHLLPGTQKARFQCPCVPSVPMMAIFINGCMMGSFSMQTWSMVAAWVFIGLIFYFSYGIHFSELRRQRRGEINTSGEHSEHIPLIQHEISLPLLLNVSDCQYNTMPLSE